MYLPQLLLDVLLDFFLDELNGLIHLSFSCAWGSFSTQALLRLGYASVCIHFTSSWAVDKSQRSPPILRKSCQCRLIRAEGVTPVFHMTHSLRISLSSSRMSLLHDFSKPHSSEILVPYFCTRYFTRSSRIGMSKSALRDLRIASTWYAGSESIYWFCPKYNYLVFTILEGSLRIYQWLPIKTELLEQKSISHHMDILTSLIHYPSPWGTGSFGSSLEI